MLKWTSTTASQFSALASRPMDLDVAPVGYTTPCATTAPSVLDMNNIANQGSVIANNAGLIISMPKEECPTDDLA